MKEYEYLTKALDATLAKYSKEVLSPYANKRNTIKFKAINNNKEDLIELPPAVVRILLKILDIMAEHRGLVIIPEGRELSPQRAAEILNIPLSELIKLLMEEKICYHKVGSRYRILIEDLMAYRNDNEEKQEAILKELVAEAQELNLGYGSG